MTAKGTYQRLAERRQPFLRRAWIASKLTLPSLLPEHKGSHAELPTPYQSVGARGVNNIASKLLISLFPQQPFFRLVADEAALDGAPQEIREEIDAELAKIERTVMQEVELIGLRVPMFEALKHLVVAGNVLTFLPDTGGLRIFHLDSYVVERDHEGNVLQTITKEEVSPLVLPEEVQALLQPEERAPGPDGRLPNIELYTWVRRVDADTFTAHQEVGAMSVRVPDTNGEWTKDKLPYNALRLSTISNESYGRGIVEEYEGDLRSLEGMWLGLVEGTAASARVLFTVDPNGHTRIEDLATAPNGGFVAGRPDEVAVLQIDKRADFSVILQAAQDITERLSRAFLLNSSVTRNAERVTAEEIRFQAQELEDTLGGVYSILSQDLQLPLLNRLMERLSSANKLPKFKKNTVRPAIVTGLEALNRGHDLQRLQLATRTANELYGPEIVAAYTNPSVGLQRIFTSTGVDTEGLLKTEEEVQQAQQQAQLAQTAQNIAVPAFEAAVQQPQQ